MLLTSTTTKLIFLSTIFMSSSTSTFGFSFGEESESHTELAVGRDGGWGSSHGIVSFLDRIASLLTFLTFGLFLLNLLLNALLFTSQIVPTNTYTTGGTGSGTISTGTGGTSTSTGGGSTSVSIGGGGLGSLGILPSGLSGPVLTGVGGGIGDAIIGINGRRKRRRQKKKNSRLKRSAMGLALDPRSISDGMAESLLTLIHAVWEDDDGRCLPRLLCESNRRAKVMGYGTNFEYLMPLCSISSLFYIEGPKNSNSTSIDIDNRGVPSVHYLSALRAIYDGHDEGNCKSKYSSCF